MAETTTRRVIIPSAFSTIPLLADPVSTSTSIAQAKTIEECLPLLRAAIEASRNTLNFNGFGTPRLDRDNHVEFLEDALEQFPSHFVGIDASRPWMVYWGLMGLYFLGGDTSIYADRVVKTFRPMQNASGGIGGGQGQRSHLAPSYVAVLSLALVGGEEAYSLINRQQMWHWLGRLKLSNGGFLVCEEGEEDIRGTYCALVMLSLLNLPFELPPDAPSRKVGLRTFGSGLGEYLSRCQGHEGGIASAPGNEAHGAYAFCGLACLSLLDEPHRSINAYLDVDALLSWLSSRQYAPEGGFAGRTNKLVDTCYSHWIGGCWPLIQAAIDGPRRTADIRASATIGNVYQREGLARYILSCCQAVNGGLRDKPSKRPDSYHTCYALAGLSLTQHFHYYEPYEDTTRFASVDAWRYVSGRDFPNPPHDPDVADEMDVVEAVHPIYVIPHKAVDLIRSWFQGQGTI